jgi:hypothetical protein
MREERLEVSVTFVPAALVERTRSLIRMVSAEGGSDGLACLGRW